MPSKVVEAWRRGIQYKLEDLLKAENKKAYVQQRENFKPIKVQDCVKLKKYLYTAKLGSHMPKDRTPRVLSSLGYAYGPPEWDIRLPNISELFWVEQALDEPGMHIDVTTRPFAAGVGLGTKDVDGTWMQMFSKEFRKELLVISTLADGNCLYRYISRQDR